VCVPTTCGDGTREETEGCDDGNWTPYDGCSPACSSGRRLRLHAPRVRNGGRYLRAGRVPDLPRLSTGTSPWTSVAFTSH
jgi:cysteine-rich repeat protein